MKQMAHTLLACVLVAMLCFAPCEAQPKGWQINASEKSRAKEVSKGFAVLEELSQRADQTLDMWWGDYKSTWGKAYAPGEDAARKANFKAALIAIRKLNDDPSMSDAFFAPNENSDTDFDTYKKQVLLPFNPAGVPMEGRKLAETQPEVPALNRRLLQTAVKVNWTSLGKVTSVKNQGSCGSCWAFAAAAAVESAHLIVRGGSAANINLSEQQLVSCATSTAGYGSFGCNGGYSDRALKYVMNVNLTTEARWPYTRSNGVCSASLLASPTGTAVKHTLTSLTYAVSNSRTSLMAAVNKQPLVIYFTVANPFYYYAGGIFPATGQCGAYPASTNHAMLLTGYYWSGSLSGSYWIIKNSWGTSWGEQGYVRVAMTGDGIGPCGMYQYAFAPPLSFLKTLW